MIFLNNTNNRNHSYIFGQDAFYDLNLYGYQGNLIRAVENNGRSIAFRNGLELNSEDTCIVYSYRLESLNQTVSTRRILLRRFRFERIEIRREDNIDLRVFYGNREEHRELSREECVNQYPDLFDIRGYFKRVSVLFIDNTQF